MQLLILLIGTAAAAVSAGTLLARQRRTVRALLILTCALLCGGAILFGVSIWQYAHASAEAGTLDWARDAYALWLRWSGIFALVSGGVSLLAAILRHKMARARALVCGMAAELILLAGSAYAVVCESAVLAVDRWVMLGSAGLAALVTAACAVDLARRARK